MSMKTMTKRGQSTVEYAVMIAVIIAALLAMQIYVKRGAMGKLRDVADQIGEQFTPLGTTYNFNHSQGGGRTEVTTENGVSRTQFVNDRQGRIGNLQVHAPLNQENLF